MNKESIYGLTLEQLKAWLIKQGHKPSRAVQVWRWLYRKHVDDFSKMADVNKECIQLLTDSFRIGTLKEYCTKAAADGTVKFLFQLHDNNLIETVLMRNKFGLSVCTTTQVGCNIGCSFCASGLLKKNRDLSCNEMVEQIIKVQQYLDSENCKATVSHVVVMGIGEPFDNFNNVVNFLQIIKEHNGLAIAARRITVSTSGLADKIMEFTDARLQVNLAISLHAPNDELRSKIMKINNVYSIDKIMQAVDYFCTKTQRRVTLEYILLKDVNDKKEHACELAELIGDRRKNVNVNLIPYNPVDEHSHYQRSELISMRMFYDVLKKHGIHCNKRLEHGTDIDAACGQLRSKQIQAMEEALDKDT